MTFRAQQPALGLGSKLATKPFVGTYSKLKNFETCPKRSYHLDFKQDVPQETTDELDRGNRLHGAMASRIRSDIKLPAEFHYMEQWAAKLSEVTTPGLHVVCEMRLGLSKTLQPTMFMEKNTYWRTVIDYLGLMPSGVEGKMLAHIVDYKTGKPKEDFDQLALYAMTIFAHFKEVAKIRTTYIWIEYNDTTHEKFVREDMNDIWENILPRVMILEDAYNKGIEAFPPKPGGLCKEYCPIRTCEHNGKRVKA